MAEISPPPPSIIIRPWLDPVVDDDGFDPRSRYVEVFWLGVLGPPTIHFLRRRGMHIPPGGCAAVPRWSFTHIQN